MQVIHLLLVFIYHIFLQSVMVGMNLKGYIEIHTLVEMHEDILYLQQIIRIPFLVLIYLLHVNATEKLFPR